MPENGPKPAFFQRPAEALMRAATSTLALYVYITVLIEAVFLYTVFRLSGTAQLATILGMIAVLILVVAIAGIKWVNPPSTANTGGTMTSEIVLKAMAINLVFPLEPYKVELDVQHCVLEIRDKEGTTEHSGVPNLALSYGGWVLRLDEKVRPSDSVSLDLVESNGRKWKVVRFDPYESQRKALPVTEAQGGS